MVRLPRPATAVLVAVATLVVLTATATPSQAATPSLAATLPTWPANPNWQALVPAPTSDSVRPVSIVRTSGSVTNPGALTQGTGSTVLTTSSTSSPATVVVDFGKEVGGTPFATVSSSGSETLRIATSEALSFLTPTAAASTTTTTARRSTWRSTGRGPTPGRCGAASGSRPSS